MDILGEIEQRLGKYPELKYEVKETSITVFPTSETGFEVALYFGNPDLPYPYSVYFNGWRGQFSDGDEARNCKEAREVHENLKRFFEENPDLCSLEAQREWSPKST